MAKYLYLYQPKNLSFHKFPLHRFLHPSVGWTSRIFSVIHLLSGFFVSRFIYFYLMMSSTRLNWLLVTFERMLIQCIILCRQGRRQELVEGSFYFPFLSFPSFPSIPFPFPFPPLPYPFICLLLRSRAHLNQLGDLWSAVSSPSVVHGRSLAENEFGAPTPSPGWGPRGQGPSKNRQGPSKKNWTVYVKKSKKTKWQPCVGFCGGWSRRLSHTHSYPGCHAPDRLVVALADHGCSQYTSIAAYDYS